MLCAIRARPPVSRSVAVAAASDREVDVRSRALPRCLSARTGGGGFTRAGRAGGVGWDGTDGERRMEH